MTASSSRSKCSTPVTSKTSPRSVKIAVVLRTPAMFRFVQPIIDRLQGAAKVIVLISKAPWEEKLAIPARAAHLDVRPATLPVEEHTRRLRVMRDTSLYFFWHRKGLCNEETLNHMLRKIPAEYRDAISRVHDLRLGRLISLPAVWATRLIERISAPDSNIVERLSRMKPDLLLATPCVYPFRTLGVEKDYLKAAKALGIPTAVLVASWDNLTTKGTFHITPDKVLVWNQYQVDEAVRFHDVPARQVEAVGAPVFDQMFDGCLRESREDFCATAGLDPGRPYVLWTASSAATKAHEPAVVERLMSEMRVHKALSGCQILVRPHPKHAAAFDGWARPDIAVWHKPEFPDTDEAAAALCNSITHSCAVAGLSTSAFLEAGILDRPCALMASSLAAPDSLHAHYAHFPHLLREGYPATTKNEPDCARWLAELITSGADPNREARQRFVRSFLRPHGLDVPAGKIAADALLAQIKAARHITKRRAGKR